MLFWSKTNLTLQAMFAINALRRKAVERESTAALADLELQAVKEKITQKTEEIKHSHERQAALSIYEKVQDDRLQLLILLMRKQELQTEKKEVEKKLEDVQGQLQCGKETFSKKCIGTMRRLQLQRMPQELM